VKALSDFVTSEQDVKKGNNRLPLNLARLHEEDVLKDEKSRNSVKSLETEGDELGDLNQKIQHKKEAYARSASIYDEEDGNDDFSS
jgi:hypothetical protein